MEELGSDYINDSGYLIISLLMSPDFQWTGVKVGGGGDPVMSYIHQSYH